MNVVLQGPSGRITLGSMPLAIGFTSDNKLVINNSQPSSLYALLNPIGQNYAITAVSSAYPVSVNGQMLEPNRPHWLIPGDTIGIGEIMLSYEEDKPTYSTPEPPPTVQKNSYVDNFDEEKTIKEVSLPTGAEVKQVAPIAPAAPAYSAGTQQPQYQVAESGFQHASLSPTPPPFFVPPPPTGAEVKQAAPITPVAPAYGVGTQQPQYQVAESGFQQAPFSPTPPPSFVPPQQQPPIASSQVWQQASMPGLHLQQPPFIEQKKTTRDPRMLLITLVVLLVLVVGGSGIAIYQLTRPQPVVAVTSQYMEGTTPAGSTGTSLHLLGYKFSSSSPITVLLDGKPAPGQSSIRSDADGNFQADLSITSAWSVGAHKLTASDSGTYLAKNVSNVTVVKQGEAHTPGPDGAPPDDASFTVRLTLSTPGNSSNSSTVHLTVSALPGNDSGGHVCDVALDNNQANVIPGTLSDGTTYKDTITNTCSGTYKGGKLSYTETLVSEKLDFSSGQSCSTTSSATVVQFNGTFSSATSISGTVTYPGYQISCQQGGTRSVPSSGNNQAAGNIV